MNGHTHISKIADRCRRGLRVDLDQLTAFINKHPNFDPELTGMIRAIPGGGRQQIVKASAAICEKIIQKYDTNGHLSKTNAAMMRPRGFADSNYSPVAPSENMPVGSARSSNESNNAFLPSGIRLKLARPPSKQYLKDLQNEIGLLESRFSVESLTRDIKDDTFVQAILRAEVEALEKKALKYKKLQDDYSSTAVATPRGSPKAAAGGQQPHASDTTDIQGSLIRRIKYIRTQIGDNLKSLNADIIIAGGGGGSKNKFNQKRVDMKRRDLEEIVGDIRKLLGESRQGVRTALVKVVHTFKSSPEMFIDHFNNFVVTGKAGSGKTKVATTIAKVFNKLGVLLGDSPIMATRSTLVAETMGGTGPKTLNVLVNSLENVLFIDEAYSLTPCKASDTSYEQECMAELINFQDKFVGCFITIVAGYKDEMNDCFMPFNEGLPRRFPRVLDLLDYTDADARLLYRGFGRDLGMHLPRDKEAFIKGIVQELNAQGVFINQAGDIKNLTKMIAEDAILYREAYDLEYIKLTIKRFCAGKGFEITAWWGLNSNSNDEEMTPPRAGRAQDMKKRQRPNPPLP